MNFCISYGAYGHSVNNYKLKKDVFKVKKKKIFEWE